MKQTSLINDVQLRAFARAGALEVARGIIAEFPDILPELNAAAAPVRKPRENDAPPKKRTMSAAARKRIGDAQRARWKKKKSGK